MENMHADVRVKKPIRTTGHHLYHTLVAILQPHLNARHTFHTTSLSDEYGPKTIAKFLTTHVLTNSSLAPETSARFLSAPVTCREAPTFSQRYLNQV